MGESLEFRVLGTPEVRRGRNLLNAGHARQLSVLVALLVSANRLVSVDQLLTRVWGERPPARARSSLYSYLSRLRAVLGADGAEIVRRTGGYVFEGDPLAIDLHRFRDLTARGEHGAALELVRGQPFAGLDTPWFDAQRDTVGDEIAAAEMAHTDARLAAGEHLALVPELLDRAAARPFDERVAGQLMRALAGAGRQAEAFEHFESLRRRLADELGIDPGAALRDVYAQLVTGENPTAPPGPGRPPRQLPAPPRQFVGRADELAALDDVAPIITVCGTGGIGKTWLALRWAHERAVDFPDGQLFVDLRGYAPDAPMKPEDAVQGFITSLGVPPEAIPPDPHAQAALYRTLVADRRMLIVLDNAVDTAQVVPLLPGGAGCRVLVTSRDRLLGLATAHGARPVVLDALPADAARQLLVARIGAERLDTEPEAVGELVAHCGGLPLALALVAGRASLQTGLPLAELAASLRDETSRLGELDGDPSASVPAALSWSLAALHQEHAQAFALLGVPDGPDISLAAATSLFGVPAHEALRALERVSLLHQHVPGRWRMHDLVALYAGERARQLPSGVRDAASRRMLAFYVLTTWAGEQLLSPLPLHTVLPEPEPGTVALTFPDSAAALDWYTAEQENLLAAQRLATRLGLHRTVWDLARNMTQFYFLRGHVEHSLATWEAALAVATDHSPAEFGVIHRRVAYYCAQLGRHEKAVAHVEKSRVLCEEQGLRLELGHTHRVFGVIYEKHQDLGTALEHARTALRIYREIDHRKWQGDSLNQVSYYLALRGEYAEARATSEEALRLNQAYADKWAEGNALDTLGFIARKTGDLDEARQRYEHAARLYLDIGNHVLMAGTLNSLGDVLADSGHLALARQRWQEALRYYEDQADVVKAEEVRKKLTRPTAS